MPLLPWEETLTCPYNPSHQLTEKRMQVHLVKCRKNHPNSEVGICAFNATHHIAKTDLEYHQSTCPDRKMVELTKYSYASSSKISDINPPQISLSRNVNDSASSSTAFNLMDENWEKEATVRYTYDPKKKASNSSVLRYIQGATPSERSEFRAQEKIRLNNLEANNRKKHSVMPSMEDGAPGLTTPKIPSRKSMVSPLPLRRPSFIGNADVNSSSGSCLGLGSVNTSFNKDGDGVSLRQGTITSQLLASYGKSGKSSVKSLTNDSMDEEQRRKDEEQSLVIERLRMLSLGRGRKINPEIAPLRRPSGVLVQQF